MLLRKPAIRTKQLASMVVLVIGVFAASSASAQISTTYRSSVDSSQTGDTQLLVNGTTWVSEQVEGDMSAGSASKQYVSIPAIDLSSSHAITLTFWSKRSYSTAGSYALLESTADFTQSTTGFALFPDDPTCAGIRAAIWGDVGLTANCYSQPSSSVWHHFAVVLDKTQSAGNQVTLYVDGALQRPSRSLAASTNTNSFGNNPIYVFSQGGTSSLDTGPISDLRLYSGALAGSQIKQVYELAQTKIREDVVRSVDSYGTMTTPSITTSANNELLVAFVSYDGSSGINQTTRVTGGGLTWTLRSRSDHQSGTAEIWSAVAPKPFTTTVTSQPGNSGNWHGSLTVVGFLNASRVGKVGQRSAPSGAPDIALANIAAGNWVYAVGNDWDNPIARTPVPGQVLVHQRVDTQIGDTYWVQSTAAPSTVSGTVDIHDSAPTSDQWNYAAVEVVSSSAQGILTASPTSVSFGNVNVHNSATQTVTLRNTGTASLTVSSVSISGSGFSLASVSTPFTLAVGATKVLIVTFAPTVSGAASGSISVRSNASDPNLSIPLSGTGTIRGPLTATPPRLNFGSVQVNTTSSLTVMLTNTGTGPVAVSAVSISGTGFSLASVRTPFTVAAGARATLAASFRPTVTGAFNGAITVASNATNPSLSIPLSGTGVATVQHQVTLSWTASTSQVAGYNVYRATNSNGPFTVLNTGLITATSYVDHAVAPGATYYYYATAVDSHGNQSVASNHVSATVP